MLMLSRVEAGRCQVSASEASFQATAAATSKSNGGVPASEKASEGMPYMVPSMAADTVPE